MTFSTLSQNLLNLIPQITNHTASTLEVSCTPGFSGGLEQHFVMEVFETLPNNTQALVASNWSESAVVAVVGLIPESNYIVSVKAVNERGESSPVYVGGKTEGFVRSLPRAISPSRMPILFVLVGVLVTLMILGAFTTAAITFRRARRLKKRRKSEEEEEAAEIEASFRSDAAHTVAVSGIASGSSNGTGNANGKGNNNANGDVAKDETSLPLLSGRFIGSSLCIMVTDRDHGIMVSLYHAFWDIGYSDRYS